MTDQERDPAAPSPEGAADPEALTDAATPDAVDTEPADVAGSEAEGDFEDVPTAYQDSLGTPAGTAAAAVTGSAGRRKGKGAPAKGPVAAPSVAQEAVHVSDRASAVFVIVVVGVFVAIILYGLLFGHSGFVTDVMATPTPVPTVPATAAPTVAPSAAPSASASSAPSASASSAPSASASAAPSAGPSGAPSTSPSAVPSTAPSAAPASPSPAAS
jgi:hypothetical protein